MPAVAVGMETISADPKSKLLASLLPTEEDLLYEEEILRNPFTLKLWWRYLQARRGVNAKKRYVIFERALKALPGSYKLWHAYLKERKDAVRGLCINHPSYEALNNTFERALVTMHKMPRIWIDYIQFLIHQKLMTRTRRTCDRALQALPVTQHDRVWELYLKFLGQEGVPVETALRVYRRYLKLEPTHVEEFVSFLISVERWQEAAERLADMLNNADFVSVKGKTKHQLWLELCDILTTHATDITGIKVDAIIRGGIRKFTSETGRLWTSLADFYIRKGLFERARDIYEEGMVSVMTVRDFSVIFDAYTQFEESMIAVNMDKLEEESDDIPAVASDDWLHDESADLDLRMARLEFLMERRPILVSSVLLRQNPHNVQEWHKRVTLFKDDPARQILTYTEAVKTVDPMKAAGKPHTLWVAFARLYEEHGDLENARVIFDKAVMVNYKSVDDLAQVWCDWAEMELKHKNFQYARDLLKKATLEPPPAVLRQAAQEGKDPVQLRLFKSFRLWSFYVDLEESLGSLEGTRAIYERILDLRIASPKTILNYALLLEEEKFFEDSFRVYERGVSIFKYPHVKDIWTAYLSKFVARYGGKKLERARDLFEQAVEKVPASEAKALYLQYAKLEEEFGLARHAMAVYDRAVQAVAPEDKLSIYDIYIACAAENFGISKTRDIYQRAIESGLPDKDVKVMCLKFAAVERKLGEIDRARAIFSFAAQMADPRRDADFWQEWNNFEIAHGNEDTFREMLRLKRTVSASYSQTNFIMPEYAMQKEGPKAPAHPPSSSAGAAPGAVRGSAQPPLISVAPTGDSMAQLEDMAEEDDAENRRRRAAEQRSKVMFVSASADADAGEEEEEGDRRKQQEPKSPRQEGDSLNHNVNNPEEIELGEGEDEDEDEDEGNVDGGSGFAGVAQMDVPAAVFGDLADKAKELLQQGTGTGEAGGQDKGRRQEPMGAKERFKRQRKS